MRGLAKAKQTTTSESDKVEKRTKKELICSIVKKKTKNI
jgi:hypothetical protein